MLGELPAEEDAGMEADEGEPGGLVGRKAEGAERGVSAVQVGHVRRRGRHVRRGGAARPPNSRCVSPPERPDGSGGESSAESGLKSARRRSGSGRSEERGESRLRSIRGAARPDGTSGGPEAPTARTSTLPAVLPAGGEAGGQTAARAAGKPGGPFGRCRGRSAVKRLRLGTLIRKRSPWGCGCPPPWNNGGAPVRLRPRGLAPGAGRGARPQPPGPCSVREGRSRSRLGFAQPGWRWGPEATGYESAPRPSRAWVRTGVWRRKGSGSRNIAKGSVYSPKASHTLHSRRARVHLVRLDVGRSSPNTLAGEASFPIETA